MNQVPSLDAHGIVVLVGIVFVFFMMARDRVPITVMSLAIIATLAFGSHLFPYEGERGALVPTSFFAGFGHEALVAICSLMVLGRGLVVTGALEPLARVLAGVWKINATLAMLVVLLICLSLSGVLNDTPIVVLMTPVLISLAARTASSPGPLLMPMNFAVLIGGTATAIGTSTNLLVVSLAEDLGAQRFGIFDFTPLVMMAAVPASLYLLLVAPRLLRGVDHVPSRAERQFDSIMAVPPGAYVEGKTISEMRKRCSVVTLRGMQAASGGWIARLPTTKIQAGFLLHVTGTPAGLKECEARLGSPLAVDNRHDLVPRPADITLGAAEKNGKDDDVRDKDEDLHLVQLIVSADSAFIGQRFGDLSLSQRYGLQLLAVHRTQEVSADPDVRGWVVHAGDVLLVQGSSEDIALARNDTEVLTLDGQISLPRTRKAPLAIGIMAGVVLAAASGLLPIAIASLVGAVLMLLTRCVLPRNLGRAMSAEVILLIPASLAMGEALRVTGGADWMAAVFLEVAGGLPIRYVLVAIIALMSVMTNFISNSAAAVIGTPIAIAIANELGVPPEPFALAVLFGCNLCFATPFGYQTNLIVMSAAGYRFSDFVRVGVPLTVIMLIAYAWILPTSYGL